MPAGMDLEKWVWAPTSITRYTPIQGGVPTVRWPGHGTPMMDVRLGHPKGAEGVQVDPL